MQLKLPGCQLNAYDLLSLPADLFIFLIYSNIHSLSSYGTSQQATDKGEEGQAYYAGGSETR